MARHGTARKIRNFVFLATEGTGPARQRPHLTKITMMAVSRDHLLAMSESATNGSPWPSTQRAAATARPPRVPRVVHRYVTFYNPYKAVSPSLGAASSLCNEALEHLPPFCVESAETIRIFLSQLPRPAAVLAHHEERLDFPLLMAELARVAFEGKMQGVLCVDTLPAIQRADMELELQREVQTITHMARHFTQNFTEERPQERATPAKQPRTEEPAREEDNLAPSTLPGQRVSAFPGQAHHLNTPSKSASLHPTAVSTPTRPVQKPPQPGTPSGSQVGTLGSQAEGPGRAHRALRFGEGSATVAPSYELRTLYKRLFNVDQLPHVSEFNCLALLKVCGHYGTTLVQLLDASATSLAEVQPMWRC